MTLVEFHEYCKRYNAIILKMKVKYQNSRFDYIEYKEVAFMRAYYGNKDLTEFDKHEIQRLHDIYFTNFLKYLEMQEKFKNFCIKFKYILNEVN